MQIRRMHQKDYKNKEGVILDESIFNTGEFQKINVDFWIVQTA